MAKIVKTLTVSWQWSGDKYSLRGFNLAITPAAKNPKEEVVATAFVETKEIKQTYSYKMGNVTLDKDAQYKIWVQAVYENSDSDWVATGGATVTDDGSATIITKTDREIQDVVNMASDNILTRQEKISLRREWQEIVYEFLEIESTAISQGIPSSNTTFSNFKSKGNALGTYLNGGTAWTISSNNKTSFPLWINDSNLGNNTSINGNTYRETFRVYYEAKVKILEEINKYKVNSVQVGGTNLLTGTKDFNVGKGTGTVHSEKHNGFTVLYKDFSTATSGYSDVCAWNSAINVKQNKEYTLSFYAKGSGNIYSYFYPNNVASGYSSEGKKTTAPDGGITHTLTNNWKRYWIVWKTLPNTTGLKHVLPMRLLTGATGYICGVKFEEGNKATDWSPSLEEMENAYTVILTNEAQVIPTNSNRVPTSNTTYFTDIQVYQGTVQRNDYAIGTINSANGITVSKTSSRVNFAVSTNTALATDGGNFIIPITIDGKTFNKTFSWSCSKQGNTGATGNAGQDAITIVLSNENHTFPCESNGNIPTALSTTCVVTAYKGGTSVTPTIGSITNPTGMTISKNGATLTIQANTGTSLADSGTVNIPITVDGKTFNKTFTWSKAKKGATGATGATGAGAKTVDIIASSQVFKSTDGGLTFSPTTITMTPKLQNVTYSNWQYSTNGGSTWNGFTNSISGWSVSSGVLTINKDCSLFTKAVTSVVFRLNTNNSSVYDTMTIVKLYDVTDLEIGGRNLARKGSVVKYNTNASATTVNDANFTTDGSATISRTAVINEGAMIDRYVVYDGGANYVATFKMRATRGTVNSIHFYNGRGHKNSKVYIDGVYKGTMGQDLTFPNDTNYHKVEVRFEAVATDSSIANAQNTNHIIPQPMKGTASAYTIQILNLKIEKGNKATDWSPAPEDVAADIDNAKNEAIDSANNTLTTTITNYYTKAQTDSQINVAKEAINLSVSNTYETKTNVTSKVTSTLNSAKSYADTKKNEAISSASSDATTKANNALNNAKSYADTKKTEAINAASSDATNKVNSAKNELNTKIDGIQVGGRNLFKGYNENEIRLNDYQGTGSFTQFYDHLAFDPADYVGKQFTISFYAKSPNGTTPLQVYNRNTNPRYFWFYTVLDNNLGNEWKYYSYTFTNTDRGASYSSYESKKIEIYAPNRMGVLVKKIKIELGNKATDWTPAPEDVAANIDTAKTEAINSANSTLTTTIANYYTKEQTNSQINIAKDAINLGVSNTYETKTNVTSKVTSTLNSAKSYADTKKNEAISSASTDATTKANNALNNAKSYADTKKNEAINTASSDATNKVNSAKSELNTAIGKKANSADVYTKSQVYTKAQTDSAIKVAKDEINLGVSNTYETKTNVESKISTAVNNVQIGGRNLQKNTEFKTNLTSWTVGTGYARDTSKLFENTNTVKFTRTGLTADSVSYLYSGTQVIPIEVGQTVTASANFYTDNTSGIDGGKAFIGIWFYSSSGSAIASSKTNIPFVNGKWVKCLHTATAPANTVYTAIVFGTNRNGTYYIAKPMFEKGTKATDWSPAPEDIENEITILESETKTLKESVSSLQLNSDSINASVKSLQETVTNTTNGLASDISSIQNQVNLAMTANDVKLEIQKEMAKGTNKVTTATGFTFNESGLNISKSDSEMSTRITEDGMKVYRNNDVVLTANNQGVDAKNLHATTYLIIGGNSRMESVTEDGTKRTAVFWIGS